MSLSEKAKTTRQFCDELSPSCILDCPLEDKLQRVDCSICEKEKWVRLEDHQQEIAFQVENVKDSLQARIEALQSAILSIYKPKIESLERERGEQKQEIEHLWETLPLEYDVEIDEVTELGSKMQWREWLKKLKELLK